MSEQGRPIKAAAALSLFANSSEWLRERVDRKAECSCGHCYLCAYNFLARQTAAYKLQTEERDVLDRSHKNLAHRVADAGREIERKDAELAKLRAALDTIIDLDQHWTSSQKNATKDGPIADFARSIREQLTTEAK